jgi:photosystem II stability/assembly factor-like uncharacterized protein
LYLLPLLKNNPPIVSRNYFKSNLMKSFQIIAFISLWAISITACSEKKDTPVPTTPVNVTPTTTVPVVEPPKPITFFNDPVMKKANLVSLSFADDQTLFAFGNDDSKGYLFKSVDLGKTWSEVSINGTNPMMRSVNFKDEKIGVLSGRNVLGTTDGGATWQTISRPTDATQASYPKNQEGFVLKQFYDNFHSREYTELHYVNTSNLAQTKYETLFGYMSDVHFLKEKVGMLVGNYGLIYVININSDGSYDYIDPVRPVTESLLSVFLVNNKKAFVGGKNSTFLKTIDGGENWTILKTGITGNVVKLAFQNENLGYSIIENEGKTLLYKIEDSGAKWTKVETPDTTIFSDLRINSQGKAIAVGKAGAVYLF